MNPAKIINDILVKNNGVKNMPKSIRLGNLPRDLPEIETELRKIFNEIGPVRDVYVPKKNGITIGYGFVEFLDPADAVHAVAYFCKGLYIGGTASPAMAGDAIVPARAGITKARVELAEGKRRLPGEMVYREMSPAERVFVRAKILVDNSME